MLLPGVSPIKRSSSKARKGGLGPKGILIESLGISILTVLVWGLNFVRSELGYFFFFEPQTAG